jgi:hypothetical protein
VIVASTSGDVLADYLVNCAGLWANRLLAPLGIEVPVTALAAPPAPGQPPAGTPPGQRPQNPSGPGNPQVRKPPTPDDDDDDDDDDDVVNDPLARLFESGSGPGHSNGPIIGVASKKKGKAMSSYFGLDSYEDWIFIYIPRQIPVLPTRVSQ